MRRARLRPAGISWKFGENLAHLPAGQKRCFRSCAKNWKTGDSVDEDSYLSRALPPGNQHDTPCLHLYVERVTCLKAQLAANWTRQYDLPLRRKFSFHGKTILPHPLTKRK